MPAHSSFGVEFRGFRGFVAATLFENATKQCMPKPLSCRCAQCLICFAYFRPYLFNPFVKGASEPSIPNEHEYGASSTNWRHHCGTAAVSSFSAKVSMVHARFKVLAAARRVSCRCPRLVQAGRLDAGAEATVAASEAIRARLVHEGGIPPFCFAVLLNVGHVMKESSSVNKLGATSTRKCAGMLH